MPQKPNGDEPEGPKTWSYIAGWQGRNRVRVYERYAGGPLWIDTWPGGKRKRESLRRLNKVPVYDKDLAKRIAVRIAAKLDEDQHQSDVRMLLSIPESHTLKELLDEYHDRYKPRDGERRRGRKEWSPSHNRNQEAHKKFFLERLGRNRDVRRIRAVEVEEVVMEAADLNNWSVRTEGKYLKYLVAAFAFGQKKLKWFGEEANLSAVDVPPPDPKAAAYTTAEVKSIQRKLEDVDLRGAVAAHIAYVSLRRITAVRKLETSTWRVETVFVDSKPVRVGVVTFPWQTDKARKASEVAVAGRALELVEQLLATPAVQASGLLFPGGDLKGPTSVREPVSYEALHDWWLEAEAAVKIDHIDGRAWHGIKRTATTDADHVMGGLKEAAKQAGTLEQTLRNIYVQPDLRPKATLAVRLAELVA